MTAPSKPFPAPRVSVIVCTYRPNPEYLNRVLESIVRQTLSGAEWELIVVDSASPEPIAAMTNLRWPPGIRFVRAGAPGLALARTVGFDASRAPLIAFVDDDTVLDAEYLTAGVDFLDAHPAVASISGRIKPEFEMPAPVWLAEFNVLIAIRDFGEAPLLSTPGQTDYPYFAPVGVSICRREFFDAFRRDCEKDPAHFEFGRKGTSLASGEDNDFVISMLRRNAQVAYCPAMSLTHIIPARRLEPAYLGRLSRASSRTWEQVLWLNGYSTRPRIARWTVPLRQFRAWFRLRAWRGPREWIRWQGACGHFEGRIR